MKSNQNQIIIQFHMFLISLPISIPSNFLKWSSLAICNPLRRSYPDAVPWPANITCCSLITVLPWLFTFSPIHIDPLLDKKEDDDMVDIKATLPKEFSIETGDANRWLMAMKAYFTLHVDKFPDEVQTMVFLNRMSKGQGKAFAKAWLTKLKDECITDTNKNWTKIKKSFKATFTVEWILSVVYNNV